MKTARNTDNRPDVTRQVFYLLPNGRCPFCKTKLRIDGPEKLMFKSDPTWIDKITRKASLRCKKCDIILIEK
jgi:hypothetical protein